jgi:hypothetical protein
MLEFSCKTILGGLFPSLDAIPCQMLGPLPIDGDRAIDPYAHTMHRFSDANLHRQQKCVLCLKEGRITQTAYYCSLCCLTQVKEEDRKPSKHAYCLNKAHQCFARHTAAAYKIMNAIGGCPTKKEMVSHARTMEELSLATPATVVGPPSSKKKKRKKKKKSFYGDSDSEEKKREKKKKRSK